MHQNDLAPFHELLHTHPVTRPPLFRYLAEQAVQGTLTGEAYRTVATNLAVKTGLTLPRILVAAAEGAQALDPTITALTTQTAVEEAGSGEPREVHTLLMIRALNYHGKVVFGLPPLKLKDMQELQVLLDHSTRLLAFRVLTAGLEAATVRRLEDISSLDGLESVTLRRAQRQGFIGQKGQQLQHDDLEYIQASVLATLMEQGVLPEVIDYGQQELYAHRTGRVGYIQGVTFAGEAVADEMLFSLFQVMYKDLDHYRGRIGQYGLPEDFVCHVLPYFAAHGEYLAMVQGHATADDKKTEVIHAQRELAKLSCLDTEARTQALHGAQDFADRNLRVWNGMLTELLLRDPQLQHSVNTVPSRHALLSTLEDLERQNAFDKAPQSVVSVVVERLH
jgi:hypothetical protein